MRVLLLGFVCSGLLTGCGQTLSIEVPQTQLQERVDSFFPLDSSQSTDAPVHVVLSEPRVLLEGDQDRIGLQVRVAVSPTGDEVRRPPGLPPIGRPDSGGSVTVFSQVSYDAEGGAFFLSDVTIDEVDLAGAPGREPKAIRQVVEQVLNRYLGQHPVYTLSGDDKSAKAVRWLLKSVRVADGALQIELGP